MISFDVLRAALQGIKTKEYYECCRRILKAAQEVNDAETECRRLKAQELIRARAQLEISLNQLEYSYNELKTKYGKIETVEELIINQRIALLHNSFEKKSLRQHRTTR